MFFITGKLYLIGCLLLIVANLCMGASLVFYNAFLNDICTEDQRDKVSSRGFAVGYFGAILMLVLNLVLINYAESLNLTKGFAVRLSFLLASLWWGGFSLITFRRLKNRASEREIPEGENFLSLGFKELGQTFKELGRRRHTKKFLIAYLLYNDGIQTVINTSSLFLAQELFVNRGLETSQMFLIGVFLVAQAVGIVGAIVLEQLARLIKTKNAILASLVIWAAIVVYAYAFLHETWQAWGMGAAIGFVLGGSQALSRSLFSQMIPPGREAAFFGIYEIADRGTSWIGPIVFGIVAGLTNSYRQAILALIVFFVAGSILLYLTNTDKAIEEAKS